MNCVDSSVYIEYYMDGPNAAFFAPAIEELPKLIVPSICIYEVFKKISMEKSPASAKTFVAQMLDGIVITLDQEIAVFAAALSINHKLPMADAIIYATAQNHSATLWTQDNHFAGLPGVQFKAKSIAS